ncbi:outer membrane porin [Sulfurospirillum diekertiae]|uniref:Outer membrane porin n=1 Tax=Sulfurospirillum diekertiae TaxID=1854492 RepID=A0A290HDQ1_9BACT|nr:OprD family outer membrane porin [Sulfurospirillum diekertiae]ATB69351.1 outer membrane porin [Sulfurospirillum diekertiae]
MKLTKLSMVAIAILGLGSHVYAADTLADAFKNGKVNGTLKAWYWDRNDDGNFYPKADHQNILNVGVELGYVTDTLYGLRLGFTYQGSSSPFATDDAKKLFNKEESGQGSVLSEAYLGYQIGKTDVKVGRQYITTPLISGNPTRFFRESFEGATITNMDLPQTTLYANYVGKFQGRTGDVFNGNFLTPTGANNYSYDAPEFTKQIIIAGAGPTAFGFDGAYSLGAINKSVSNLTLSAQFAQAHDVVMSGVNGKGPYGASFASATDDISFYYSEANYVLPMSNYKLLFDANYRGSRAGSGLDVAHIDGNMLGLRAGFSELYGFGGTIAYTTVSNGDDALLGLGNGPSCYTMLSIRGPLVFNSFAGMDTYRFGATYNFSQVGITGLTSELAYVTAKQDTQSTATISTATNAKAEIEGYSARLTYAVPALKGLTTEVTYVSFDKDYFVSGAKIKSYDTDELWFNVNYKF